MDEKSSTIAVDSNGENTGHLENFPKSDSSWVQGRIDGGLSFNSDGNSNEVVIVPDATNLNFTTNLTFTITAWVRGSGIQSQSAGIVSKGFGGGGEEYTVDIQQGIGTYRFFVRNKIGMSFPLVTGVHFSGRWQHVAATFNGNTGVMKVYIDGVMAAARPGPKDLQFTSQPLTMGNRQSGTNTGYDLPFIGVIDDVRIYDYALNADQVKHLYTNSGTLLPVFYALPQNDSKHLGETASFSVLADGTGPLTYLWSKKGAVITGATSSRIQIPDVRMEDEGIYTVQVTDANNATASASGILNVKLYYWQTWWFRILAVMAAMLIVGAVVQLVERRKANQAFEQLEQRHAVDRERMRIARDMHDEIGGKLSRISLLSEMARRDLPESSMVSRQISEVSAATQEIIRTVDEIVWAVNPRHDNIYGVVHYIRRHAEEFFELTEMELELRQPPELPERHISAETRHHLFCAVKEALNNILKHADAGKVKIVFACTEKQFSVTIQDDGCGFTIPPGGFQNDHEQPAARRGSGIINTTERMQTISGEYKLLSSPGNGTVVELIIPLE